LEVSEEVVVKEGLFLCSDELESLLCDTVEEVEESLLVFVCDKFINEGSLALVSPESNQELLG
jgi:hypothetical protein